MMTILMQDDVGGLELRHKGTWYPVKPIDGTFIINFGKMMEHFSYGVIKGKV
jgi:isopenicillin N synthase-like dioxygenase